MSELRYMLDTNIVSDLIRNPAGRAAFQIERIGEHSLCVSALVASELRYGSVKKGSARLISQVESILERLVTVAYDGAASMAYAGIRSSLERRGTPIGTTDLFIAAHALALDMPLVTANTREFSRVVGLKLENWLEEAGS